MKPGDLVIVTDENGSEEGGTFVYKRMAPPDYTKSEVISVRLFSQVHRAGYTGSIYNASQVRLGTLSGA